MMRIQINPWAWPLALFGGQTLGAVIFPKIIGLDLGEIAIPLALLGLGAAMALAFHLIPDSSRLGPWKWWLPVSIYALFIFLISDRSYDVTDPPGFDLSLFHPVIYASLAFLLALAWKFSVSSINERLIIALALGTGAVYGFLDEFHQSSIPGRFASPWDFLLDLLGLVLGIGLFLYGQHRSWINPEQRRSRPAHR
jgi:VanZ family protein